MPNPRAQKPLSYDQIVKDAKSLGVPAQALLDALAGGLKGSVTATVGAPADIYNLINQASFRGQLPNIPLGSEDISKMLPDVIPTQDKSRQHTAEVGELAGSFIPTPMAGQAVKGAVKLGKVGAKALGEELGRRAVMGESFTPLMNTALPMTHVMKNKGGNWVGDTVERGLEGLKSETGSGTPAQMVDFIERQLKNPDLGEEGKEVLRRQLPQYHKESAINNWVDKNLTNYVKKEMATPEDPVRKLAEQGITHLPDNGIDYINQSVPERLALSRMKAGFPSMGIGQSNLAKGWENLADSFITSYPAKEYTKPLTKSEISRGRKSVVPENPWLTKLDPETQVTYLNTPRELSSDLGFTHIMDVLKQDLENGRLRPESLKNVSMEQAVRRAHEYDQEMAKKMRESQIKMTEGMPVHKEYPTGHKWIELAVPNKLPEGYHLIPSEGRHELPYQVVTSKGDKLFYAKDEADAAKDLGTNQDLLEQALKYEGETMGHCVGGYCPDVLEGRSRIFSLRDAKGEPHVTVEVEPQAQIGFREGEGPKTSEERFDLQTQYFNDVASGKIGNDKTFAQWWRSQNNIPEPERALQISQIKGKQNLAPKEQYLPFVQDFVKSGNWGDVGDLRNAGLAKFDPADNERIANFASGIGLKLPKYITADEFDALQKNALWHPDYPQGKPPLPESLNAYKIQPEPPVEGMKKGGAVTISDNPDTMFMELMDKKMKDGGAEDDTKLTPSQWLQAQGNKPVEPFTPLEDLKANLKGLATAPARLFEGAQKLVADPRAYFADMKAPTAEELAMAFNPSHIGMLGATKGIPVKFDRAPALTKAEINAMAERIAPQVMGEFVRAKPTASQPNPSTSVSGKSRKQFESEKDLGLKTRDLSPPVTPSEFDYTDPVNKGKLLIGTSGDVTPTGKEILEIKGVPIEPVEQQGGPEYGLRNKGIWAASNDQAQAYQNQAKRASEAYGGAEPLLHYHRMTDEANLYAMHHLHTLLNYLKPEELAKIDPSKYGQLVKLIQEKDVGFGKHPQFGGFEDPLSLNLHAQIDPDFRRHLGKILQMPSTSANFGLRSGLDALAATSEPQLRNLEAGSSGFAIAPIDIHTPYVPYTSPNRTYETDILGGEVKRSRHPVPYELSYRDATKYLVDNPPEKGANNVFGRLNFTKPRQIIDQQFQDEVGQYMDAMKRLTGKKKGGAIKKAKGGEISEDDIQMEVRPL